MKIGVLSRRAPISQNTGPNPEIEHVGGLTRVLPALSDFAELDWTTLTTQSQTGLTGLTKRYSFSELSDQTFQNQITLSLVQVPSVELDQSDWFSAHLIWPVLHDLPVSNFYSLNLNAYFLASAKVCQEISQSGLDETNAGYLVNDFQLSQVPIFLKQSAPDKHITFFLHTPWPKNSPQGDFEREILKFLAAGMLAADVIGFQTARDLRAFEVFVDICLPNEVKSTQLKVNPVSVDVQGLQNHARHISAPEKLQESDISYVHIARSDPVKNTLATIAAFTATIDSRDKLSPRKFLDLIIVPSRQQWPLYQDLLQEITQFVITCNAKLDLLDYVPIRLHIGNDYQRAICALARFDYLIICSVADGLNLIVKEGAILNNRDGVIIGTESVGAMSALGQFCVIAKNTQIDGITEAILKATTLDSGTRKAMSMGRQQQVTENDLSHWAQRIVANFKVLEQV